jgi:hypothetical protein
MIALAASINPGRTGPAMTRRETIPGIRPGEYYAVAIDDIGTEDSRDPSILSRLLPAATRVTVGDAPDTQISLRRQALADVLKR